MTNAQNGPTSQFGQLCLMAAAALALLALLVLAAPGAQAQGSRKDDIVLGPSGHPVASATVRVCQPTATGTPCTPLATLYTDATLTVPAANPLQTDGIGNYHFYAPSGRYQIQITGTGIAGTVTYPDVILAADSTSGGTGSNITAFGLTLGGNLSVAGNASIAGTFSTGNFAPSSLSVTGNSSLAGPRPYIDVTAYGAVGNAIHDDTSAIQAAINVYCTGQTLSNGGTIYFPPGTYNVSQPQNPSTAPIFTICTGIHLLGGNSSAHLPQFQEGPTATIVVNTPGSSPNAAPMFQCIFPVCGGGLTFENLSLMGYNEVVYINQASNNRFINTSLETYQGQPTGLTDNTPLKLCNTIWNWFIGGTIATNNTTATPGVLMCSDSTPGNLSTVELSYFENVVMLGGGILYRAGIPSAGPPAGQLEFKNITLEGSASNDFFTVETVGSGVLDGMSAITFDGVILADGNGSNLINFNAPSVLSGVFIKNSTAGLSAIKMTQGVLTGATVIADADSNGNPQIVDAGGNPFGNGATQNWSGFDHIVDTTNGKRLQSDLKNLFATVDTQGFPGPPLRLTPSGSAFSTLALDPAQGILFGDGSNYGFSSSIKQSVVNDVDVYASKLLPPTNVAGTATTGGSLAAGTYYYYIRSTSTGSSAQCSDSTDSAVSSAVVVGGANNAINTSVIYLPNIQFSKITVDVSTTDASTSNFYSWAITDTSGNVKCSVTAVNVTAGGASDQSCTQGTVTLPGGAYIFAFTGNATTGKIAYSGTAPLALSSATSSSTSSSGAITFPITIPAAGVTYSGYGLPAIILH